MERKRTCIAKNNPVEYGIWMGINSRCRNRHVKAYNNYGGRGISVCERWRCFASFLEDMGPRPSIKHQIERINNNGNYEPGNCKWATRKEQCRNKRNNRLLTFKGETRCVREWAEITGIGEGVIQDRIERGWNTEKALTTPVHVIPIMVTLEGKTLCLKDWAKRYNINYAGSLLPRLSKGWNIEKALCTPVKKYTKRTRS